MLVVVFEESGEDLDRIGIFTCFLIGGTKQVERVRDEWRIRETSTEALSDSIGIFPYADINGCEDPAVVRL